MACISGQAAVVQFLIELGADPAMPVCFGFMIAITLSSELIGFRFTAPPSGPIPV
jgi:hypothetical protein